MVIFPETRCLAWTLKCYGKPDKNGAFPNTCDKIIFNSYSAGLRIGCADHEKVQRRKVKIRLCRRWDMDFYIFTRR